MAPAIGKGMTKILPFRHPKTAGAVLAVISLGAGAGALVAADFGGSPWVFAPLLLWLATIGLPATIAVILTASVWGFPSPFYGFFPFLAVAATLACLAQVAAVRVASHLAGRNP